VRFLLRPGWVALTVGVVLFAIACFTLLAPWQFRRNDEKHAMIDGVHASEAVPPQPIEAMGADAPQWRQVVLKGSYLPEGEVLVRLRTVLGKPAFEVLTPLRLDSGPIVLVDRGFVRPVGGVRALGVPDYAAAPSGEVTVVGRLRHDEPGSKPPVVDGGRRQVYSVDSATVSRLVGMPLRPGYVQLNADQAGVLGALPLPELDAGPHLSYAWQWLGFGVMALVGWVLLVRRERLDQRSGIENADPRDPPRRDAADPRDPPAGLSAAAGAEHQREHR
jgi:cytochrome oxidase assembly protein ShyY1